VLAIEIEWSDCSDALSAMIDDERTETNKYNNNKRRTRMDGNYENLRPTDCVLCARALCVCVCVYVRVRVCVYICACFTTFDSLGLDDGRWRIIVEIAKCRRNCTVAMTARSGKNVARVATTTNGVDVSLWDSYSGDIPFRTIGLFFYRSSFNLIQ